MVIPNDGMCHLNAANMYSEALNQVSYQYAQVKMCARIKTFPLSRTTPPSARSRRRWPTDK